MKSSRSGGASTGQQSWVKKGEVEKQRREEYLADQKKVDEAKLAKEQAKIEQIREVYKEPPTEREIADSKKQEMLKQGSEQPEKDEA